MPVSQHLAPGRIGLRTYDVSLGFRNLDERNAALTWFGVTYLSGMTAVLAGAIKGRDVIRDARALKEVAAEVLKINPFAFDSVVRELEDLELIGNVRRSGGAVVSFTEGVPLLHDDVHERIGERWREKRPTELEQQLLVAVDSLAQTPLLAEALREEIGADERATRLLRGVGESAELIRYHPLRDGTEIAASPLYAFERPDQLVPLFERHEVERVRVAFQRLRQQPGLPVVMNCRDPVPEDMVRMGLVPAPLVRGADHVERAFLVLPYGLDHAYLTSKKQILEKALILIACIRCGEVSGGVTPITMPDRLLAALTDPGRNHRLRPHSSTERQYAPLVAMNVIRLVPINSIYAAQLVATPDNVEAVNLARTLLRRQGEALPERGNEREAAELLFTGREYLTPIETIALARRAGPALTGQELQRLWQQMAFGLDG